MKDFIELPDGSLIKLSGITAMIVMDGYTEDDGKYQLHPRIRIDYGTQCSIANFKSNEDRDLFLSLVKSQLSNP